MKAYVILILYVQIAKNLLILYIRNMILMFSLLEQYIYIYIEFKKLKFKISIVEPISSNSKISRRQIFD